VFTPDERRALVFLAVVTAVGAGFRAIHGADAVSAGAAAVAPGLQGGDIVRQAARSRRAEAMAQPLAAGERVDVDRAPADELQRLPRVGPALARRIVEEREAHGPFGTLEALRRVTGIGPRLLNDLGPHVSFGGVAPSAAAPSAAGSPGAVGIVVPLQLPRRSPDSAASRLVWVATSAPAAPGAAKVHACARPPDLNHATVAELLCLPGVGPVLAARIVAERTAHGPFRDVADLARVKGVGAARIQRLRNNVTIP
jgi:competence ComEA-like helix-hairpin-helix protein